MEDLKVLDVVDRLLTKIKTTSSGRIIYRCPICGDSEKQYHGHFYVDSSNFDYICFKCGVKGNNLIQFLLNMMVNNEINDYDVKDRQILQKYTLKKLSHYLVHKNNEEEKEEVIEEVRQEEEIEEDMIKLLTKRRTTEEQFIIDSIYLPYLRSRLKGTNHFLHELLQEKRIYLYYSKDTIYNKMYNPQTLLNRIYFNLGNSIFMSRKISDELEKKPYKKYIFYTPKKSNNEIPPFILKNNVFINTIYLVEGVFDCIKLYYFIKDDVDNVGVMSLNGKFLTKQLFQHLNEIDNLHNVVYIPDNDVSYDEVIKTIKGFKYKIQNKSINLLIGRITDSKIKDIGEFEYKEQLKKIEIVTSSHYETKNVISKLEKIKNFFQVG